MSTTRQIIVIDPSIKEPEIAAINNIARRSPIGISIHFPALYGDQTIILSKRKTAGVIIMGSLASVNDKLPWHLPLQKNKNYDLALTNHSFRCRMYSSSFRENSVYLAFSHS